LVACGLDNRGLGDVVDGGGPGSGLDGTTEGAQVVPDASTGDEDASTGDEPPDSDGASGGDDGGDGGEDGAPADAVTEPPPATCTGCNATSCCNAGKCANVGDKTCGDPGQPCSDCSTSPNGSKCIALGGHQVCGCGGPGNPNDCPNGMACHNQQCVTACDGQHPCHGGCCSGNDLATSTCMPTCGPGTTCQGNYCQ
jgi:hypothetical protein